MSSTYYKDAIKDALFPKKKGVITKNNKYIKVVPPLEMDKREIRKLRISLSLSLSTFAGVLNVSPKTVEAWESGTNTPSGSALRLMRIIEKNPDFLFEGGALEDRTGLR